MSCDTPEAISVDALMRDDPGVVIAAAGLGKCYDVFARPRDRFKQALLRRQYGRKFWALRDVSFTVRKGEALGIVGHNGAGKSTLLQILAGALRPTVGEARLRGRVASLLELGSGFLPEFTGRENVFVNGTALGLSSAEIAQRLEEIREFADIGDFFDQPVKTYSSGMFVRLAFAVQACLDPDILIVDEALAVGDIFFQQKCHAHMAALLQKGVAVLLVTHDIQAVRKYCSSVILLDRGGVVHHGDVEKGLRLYSNRSSALVKDSRFADVDCTDEASCVSGEEWQVGNVDEIIDKWPADDAFLPLGGVTTVQDDVGGVRINRVALCDQHGRPCGVFEQTSHACFYIEADILRDVEQIAIGVTLTTRDNVAIYCQNSLLARAEIPMRSCKGTRIKLRWKIALGVARGDYTFSIGVAEYPAWVAEHIESISPETFLSLGISLTNLLNVASFVVCSPIQGVQMPFIGLADMETEVQFQCLSRTV